MTLGMVVQISYDWLFYSRITVSLSTWLVLMLVLVVGRSLLRHVMSQSKGDNVRVVRLLLRINGEEYDAYGVLEDNGDYIAFEAEKIVPRRENGV